ncbi:DUF420 domain-containing protein [Evansella tamaricis]|uniref:DUF420 domain-containing protein n=1 Tax=Evansella tamaricis TaxID=2069301 RepID=A0ABS6JCK5_9BACI|nr:DUF420 domain-containing protein [Evansella tamaricis]MBU9711311.1 DUF420 domain-containing protein [Evansella tamaricis]
MKNIWDKILKYDKITVIILTIVINLLIVFLSFVPGYQGELPAYIKSLPLVNATLNSFTFLFLICALVAIRKGNIALHQRFIYAAFTTTTFFLLSYVTYHFMAESTTYGGTGVIAAIYYFILITHIVLAAVIVPLALMSFFSGYKREVERHRKWVRWTMPLWLYVSLTGVLVYLFISPYYT